jgi:CubicO group peptidase (beta-lactamase class C family)
MIFKRTFTRLIIILLLTISHQVYSLTSPYHPDEEAIGAKLDQLLGSYAYYGRLSGTVLVAHKDRIIYRGSFGFADAASSLPNHKESVYGIGSITKTFTAAAIMKLVQDGHLSTNDVLYNFFPGLGNKAHEITLHHLLSMSSGIYEDFSRTKSYNIDEVIFPEAVPISMHQLVHYFDEITTDAKPGKKYDYSNFNFILLAAIVEKVSGMDFHDFLQENFFDPLGMKSSSFGSHNAPSQLLSKPYIGLPLYHIEPDFWHDSWVTGAGGNFASATDLYKWLYSIHNRQILDNISTELMHRKHTKSGRAHYGYGWQVGSRKGFPYISHEGGTLGYVSEAGYFPEQELYIVVLTNHTHGISDIGKSVLLNHEINKEIHNILFNEPFQKLPVPDENVSVEFAGRFSVHGQIYSTQIKNGLFAIHAQNGSPSLLDVAYEQDLTENSRRFKRATRIATAFGYENFKFVRRKGEIPLRLLLSSKTLGKMWGELTGDKGEFVSYNFYRLPSESHPNHYWVRLVHKNKEVGLLLVINKRRKLTGMHIDQRFSFNGPKVIHTTVINDSLIFIDGFRYGYSDARFEKSDGKWTLIKLGRSFDLEDLDMKTELR